MWGAIIGDIVGSMYERHNYRGTDFELFTPHNFFTDDTVLTIATAHALRTGRPYADVYREFALRYPNRGYGPRFSLWVGDSRMGPYGSCGNGSATRVSPVGYAHLDSEATAREALSSAGVTHNHPDGESGARLVAGTIQHVLDQLRQSPRLRVFELKAKLRDYWTGHGVDLSRSVADHRKQRIHHGTCSETLPPAFACVLESSSYEQTLRNAVSLGGDSDTLASIAGSIAEMLFGIPAELEWHARQYLPQDLLIEIDLFKTWAAPRLESIPRRIGQYPYVTVRYMSAVYSTRSVLYLDRIPEVSNTHAIIVQYSNPRSSDGFVSNPARIALIKKIEELSKETGLRMCATFDPTDSIYAEPDGSSRPSREPPSGGLQITEIKRESKGDN